MPPASVRRGNRNRSSEAENDQLSPIVCWSLSISKSFRLIPYANKLRVIICLTGWSSICCNLEVTKGQMNTSYWSRGLLQVWENSFGKVWLNPNIWHHHGKNLAFQERSISKSDKFPRPWNGYMFWISSLTIFCNFFTK